MMRDELLTSFANQMLRAQSDPNHQHLSQLQAIVAAGFHEGRGMDFGPDHADVSDASDDQPPLASDRPPGERAGETLGQVADELSYIAGLVSESSIDEVRHVLFEQLGFRGETDNYYAPSNSLLSHVLRERRGNPITLSVVMIEVGLRAGISIEAIGMPGHFLTGHASSGQFFDPFRGGQVLSAEDCSHLWARLAQQPAAAFRPEWLAPISTGELLARTLANLRVAVGTTRDIHGLRWIAQLARSVPEVPPASMAHMAATLAEFGQLRMAAQIFEHAASTVDRDGSAGFSSTGDTKPSQALVSRAMDLRSRLN